MVRLCGPRDAIVLSWLLRVTGPGANRYERLYRCLRDGRVVVAVTAGELAWEVGFNDEQQASRALDGLDKQGFAKKFPSLKGEKRQTFVLVDREAIAKAKRALERAMKAEG
jgi:hypothetical protein